MSETAELAPASRVNTVDGTTDRYDHAISMIDTSVDDTQQTLSETPSGKDLARKGTRTSLREHATRKKYAKWRQERYSLDETRTGKGGGSVTITAAEDDTERMEQEGGGAQGGSVDFAATSQPTSKTINADRKPASERPRSKSEHYEIDILYENQRGAFFCGIPLYSHSSLLNFDPGPWITKDLKNSAVDITNAQVPDPSWQWAWKTWYVDMSHDVDEEGWQYSFSFGKTWSWHGTHPWFHSFVRRRRWLRKRIKGQDRSSKTQRDGTAAAHGMTGDYFTIHSKRDQSPGSAIYGATKPERPTSHASYDSVFEVERPPEEIKDIPTLFTALRLASIDREKIDAIRRFIAQGGDELAYLRDKIPEIMSFLVFQNSRRQLIGYIQQAASDAKKHREEHDAEHKPEGDAESHRIDNLLAAVEVANEQISLGLEYWSDRKHVLQTVQSDMDERRPRISTIFDKPAEYPQKDEDPVQDIRGIPKSAEISVNPGDKIFERQQRSSAPKPEDKGKARETNPGDKSKAGENNREDNEPISGEQARDQMYVPDAG